VLPEEADTWTAGVVFQPDHAARLLVSVDYYNIDIAGRDQHGGHANRWSTAASTTRRRNSAT
jgi:outer membrane receptor protein involved in Fe transport